MRLARATPFVVILVALAAAGPSGAATPEQDAQAVGADYRPDNDVAPCAFSRKQLVNALNVAAAIQDIDSYLPGFRDEVRAEIARHNAGGCKKAGPVANLKIVRIRARRGLRESVTVKNLGRRTARLRGLTLRDRSGARVRLGSARLGPRRSLRVFTGCAKGRKRFIRLRSRVFACHRKVVWNDSGDVVRLVRADGILVSRAGYGRFGSIKRF